MVYLFLAEGFEEIEALTPVDILRRAGVKVTTVGIGNRTVVGSHGIPVTADLTEDEFMKVLSNDNLSAIILPGGMPGTKNLDASKTVDKALETAVFGEKLICAICAAPMILGKRNLLKGREAICYPGFEQYLTGAVISNDNVAVSDNIITAKGMGVALDFSLNIVEKLKDIETLEKIRKSVIA